MGQGPDEWPHLVIAHRDPDIVQVAEHAYRRCLDPHFLVGFAQSCGRPVRVARLHGSPGKRDLARVRAQLGVSDGQRHHQLAVLIGVQEQQGRRRPSRREGAANVARRVGAPCRISRGEARINGDGPLDPSQRVGQPFLPSGLCP